MALETGTYISDLVVTNPEATDAKSYGDDHIRLLKSTVKATFPNVSGAVTPTHTELNYVDGVTSAIQTQLDAKQASDADLTAIAGLSSSGLIARTGAGTAAARTLTAPAAGITVSNGDGVSGNPTLALANDLAGVEALSGTGLAIRTGDGTWTNRTIVGPAAGIALTNGDGVSGNPTIALANDLAALEGLSSTGVIVRTGDGTATTRTLTAGSGCSIANGDGVSGNPTVSLIPGVGLGDVLGPGVSVDSEIALFSGTGGQTLKRATTTGLLKATSGVLAAAASGTDIKTINSASLLGSGDITTATLGSNTFTGGQNEARGSVAMHATTMDLWAQPNIIDGTGSAVTVTAIANAPQAGARRVLYPVAASIITNGATFAVDGAANHTAAAGDKWEFEALTTSTYKVHVTKKDGTAVVAAAGGAGLTPISTTTISGNPTTVDITTGIDATYDDYMVVLRNVKMSDNYKLAMRLYKNGAFQTATYRSNSMDFLDSHYYSSTDFIPLMYDGAFLVKGGEFYVNGTLWLRNVNAVIANAQSINGTLTAGDGDSHMRITGNHNSAYAVRGLRLYDESGSARTFTSGTIQLFGLKLS